MSSDTNERRQVSKVSFSPISSELMVVRIRKSEAAEEQIPKMSSVLQAETTQKHSKRRKDRSNSKATMTDSREIICSSSQTASSSFQTASAMSQTAFMSHESATKEEKISLQTADGSAKREHAPCMKHAAENISRKASEPPVLGGISMCNNCSRSMLSYIFLVQDFLDSLAMEIRGGESPGCLQCAREEVRNNMAAAYEVKRKDFSSRSKSVRNDSLKSRHVDAPGDTPNSRTKSHRLEPGNDDVCHRPSEQQQNRQINTGYSTAPASRDQSHHSWNSDERREVPKQPHFGSSNQQQHSIEHKNSASQWTGHHDGNACENQNNQKHNNEDTSVSHPENTATHSQNSGGGSHFGDYERPVFRAPMERSQPVHEVPKSPDDSGNFHSESPSLYRDDVDGIVSTLSNVERDIYESARNKAGWDGFTESQEKYALPPSSNLIASEAFVTSCRNNAEAIGCLVVGTSLLLCRTSRTLCVLVSDGVSTAFRNALSAVFQTVQYTRSLDSLGTTKLALLEQPELGISFEKLNIWRLTQFTKCVYLNPDTLVIQNCDELFDREELSAVPDIGWPDCFNGGVFVFSPNIDTFWKLMEFAEKQGSYDGGDQGLLNSYFPSWSADINKKLSFIYNLMANVSYTYTPAFRQFGRDVKIVQFHGSFKPWHVKFFSKTGQISPSSPVHPTYVQFVHIWLSIFRISVLRILPKNIQSYATREETICAVETLRFFPLPSESEADFFLTPPSVRLRRAEIKLNRSEGLPLSEAAARRKSAEFLRYNVEEEQESIQETMSQKQEESIQEMMSQKQEESIQETMSRKQAETIQQEEEEVSEVPKPDQNQEEEPGNSKARQKKRDPNAIPGSEVGDYQGMKVWEQGRMDYKGSDSSDNVIKRLEFLMTRNK